MKSQFKNILRDEIKDLLLELENGLKEASTKEIIAGSLLDLTYGDGLVQDVMHWNREDLPELCKRVNYIHGFVFDNQVPVNSSAIEVCYEALNMLETDMSKLSETLSGNSRKFSFVVARNPMDISGKNIRELADISFKILEPGGYIALSSEAPCPNRESDFQRAFLIRLMALHGYDPSQDLLDWEISQEISVSPDGIKTFGGYYSLSFFNNLLCEKSGIKFSHKQYAYTMETTEDLKMCVLEDKMKVERIRALLSRISPIYADHKEVFKFLEGVFQTVDSLEKENGIIKYPRRLEMEIYRKEKPMNTIRIAKEQEFIEDWFVASESAQEAEKKRKSDRRKELRAIKKTKAKESAQRRRESRRLGNTIWIPVGEKDKMTADEMVIEENLENGITEDQTFSIVMKDMINSFKFLYSEVIQHIDDSIGSDEDFIQGHVLDLGCGDGAFLSECIRPLYSGAENLDRLDKSPYKIKGYLGIDIAPRRLKSAIKNKRKLEKALKYSGCSSPGFGHLLSLITEAAFEEADITSLDRSQQEFYDDKYGMIRADNVIHWLTPQERRIVFEHAYRMLKVGGLFVITCNAPNTNTNFQGVYTDVFREIGIRSPNNPNGYDSFLFRENPLAPLEVSRLKAELETFFTEDGFLFASTAHEKHKFSDIKYLLRATEAQTKEAYLRAVPHYAEQEKDALFRKMKTEYMRRYGGMKPVFDQYTHHLFYRKI